MHETRLVRSAVLLSLGLLGGCATLDETPATRIGLAQLQTAEGVILGTATLVAKGDGTTFSLAVARSGLKEGALGLHLHAIGKCDAPGFASAGAHLNPSGHQHGSANPQGPHLGDLPNLVIDRQGAGVVTAELSGSAMALAPILFDSDGSALVLHAAPDDYRTDPSGNSGVRLACGVVHRAKDSLGR